MADFGISFTDDMMLKIINGEKTRTSRVAKGSPPKCRHKPGDTLWCREVWRICVASLMNHTLSVIYRADRDRKEVKFSQNIFEKYFQPPNDNIYRWRSSRHMPRWASRVELRVLDVQLVRIQNITTKQIIAEGIHCGLQSDFISLWDSIYKKSGASWASNPWVFGIDFEVTNKEEKNHETNGVGTNKKRRT